MAGLCEGGNEPPGSLKANKYNFFETQHWHGQPIFYHQQQTDQLKTRDNGTDNKLDIRRGNKALLARHARYHDACDIPREVNPTHYCSKETNRLP
ncbi:hypothetical protein ANN_16408 [Periplaneta americana]|uniref:Uncharacterized protein n=1 Tax=Periplaneta americana TaxID=6978 RepID=A0ABQ8SJ69_PERAM|nr:hypothetical protein ANN_16408 [Periplaneta americana]